MPPIFSRSLQYSCGLRNSDIADYYRSSNLLHLRPKIAYVFSHFRDDRPGCLRAVRRVGEHYISADDVKLSIGKEDQIIDQRGFTPLS